MLFTIVISLPLALPRFLGYDMYNVVSGSMQPAIPVGSVIYVQPSDPAKIKADDVIAFFVGDSVIVHRVMENKHLEGVFITKGDANPVEDLSDVPYHDMIGKVVFHIPYIGDFLSIFSTMTGKIYVLLFAMCGIMFNILAGRLRNRTR
ncbi:MAG: signal peptidase I [Firmicutes bacterium]|nr:signal peptidase I [Bacillota bacterium]